MEQTLEQIGNIIRYGICETNGKDVSYCGGRPASPLGIDVDFLGFCLGDGGEDASNMYDETTSGSSEELR